MTKIEPVDEEDYKENLFLKEKKRLTVHLYYEKQFSK